jgi:hypothetical protein
MESRVARKNFDIRPKSVLSHSLSLHENERVLGEY